MFGLRHSNVKYMQFQISTLVSFRKQQPGCHITGHCWLLSGPVDETEAGGGICLS